MDENTYVPIILLIIILALTYLLLGIKALTSNIFMLSIYTMFVPILFFTYGAYIEKETVRGQTERLVDSMLEDVNRAGIQNSAIPRVTEDTSMDDTVKQINDGIIKNAFMYTGIALAGGVVLSILLWKIAKEKFDLSHIIYENFGLLFLVAVTEIAFFGLVSRNYRTLDTNEIKVYILDKLVKVFD